MLPINPVQLHTAPSAPVIEEEPVLAPITSDFRRVFQTTEEMKTEFVKFLQTIFYKLDEKKVLAGMERLLADPTKTDEQVYTELLGEIGNMKKRFAPLWEIKSLFVLKKGMGTQADKLLKNLIFLNFILFCFIIVIFFIKNIFLF